MDMVTPVMHSNAFKTRSRWMKLGVFLLLALTSHEARADIMAPFVMSLSQSAVVLLPVIVIVEALVLWRFGHIGPWRATWLAFVTNLASTLVGVALGLVSMPFPAVLIDLALVPLFLAATVAMEGRLLRWLASSVPHPYRLSLRMNLVSYAILVAGGVYFAHEQSVAKRQQRDRALVERAQMAATSARAVPYSPDAAVP